MIIKCAICQSTISSVDIDKDRAIKEVSDRLSNHVIHNHPEKIRLIQTAIAKLTQMLVWFCVLTETGKIPEEGDNIYQSYFIGKVEETRIELAKVLGIEIIGRKDEIELVPLPDNPREQDNGVGEDSEGAETEVSEVGEIEEEKAY